MFLKRQCIFIPKTAVKQNGIYLSHLGTMKGLEELDVTKITNDCRLLFDKVKKRYTLYVPVNIPVKNIPNRQPIVAIDPGEKYL